jgi:hypothetical protein
VLRRPSQALLLLALFGLSVAGALATAGCGAKHELDIVEGEAVQLGDLSYNVQLSRFLNPGDSEDHYYLTGQGRLPSSKDYFGVFIQIKSRSGRAQPIPRGFTIEDTQGNRYSPRPSSSVFALDLGGRIEPHSSAPAPDTPAASGPTQGALILYILRSDITENRPLHMLIPAPHGEPARVKLDI